MKDEAIYRISLTLIEGLGPVHIRNLIDRFGTASSVFNAPIHHLSSLEGIGSIKAESIKRFVGFSFAEDELKFCDDNHIQILFLTDPLYPRRLLNCYDAPTVLYYKGTADLNTSKVVTIIGTRSNTDYGKSVTEKIVQDLAAHGVLVVSGLAIGIDAIAHKAAISNGLPTVGILGHGLDMMYPPQNKSLSFEMLLNGGLLTEFRHGITPEAFNFPRRNRIAAGMSDCTLVIESQLKGGSMITAEMAYGYNRDLFAVPGRLNDHKSKGCLHLIQQNKAIIYTNAEDFIATMGWDVNPKKTARRQRELFIELTPDEKIIMDILNEKEETHIDELHTRSGLNSSSIAASILNLELQSVIICLPGKVYKVL